MFELIIGLGLGYFLGRFVTRLSSPKYDRLLVWNKDIFAWRGVPLGSRLDDEKKYLAALQVFPTEFEQEEQQ